MRKYGLFAILILLAGNLSAQYKVSPTPLHIKAPAMAAKTTSLHHDSLYMTHLGPHDTVAYTYTFHGDSGIVTGTNAHGHYGFAERYSFNGHDSEVRVIGVAAVFVGKVTPSSTRLVDIKIWQAGSTTAGPRPHLFYSGLPTSAPYSVLVPYTALGIADTSVTLKEFYFATPTAPMHDTFFVGYTTNYTWDSLMGDTIGIATTQDGSRSSPTYTVAGADTIVNVQNAVITPMNIWYDNGFDFGFKVHYWAFPIVNTNVFLKAPGITKDDFSFLGNYPNPAVSSTSLKFSLGHPATVTIKLVDVCGRVASSIIRQDMGPGEHIVTLPVANLSAGNYLCVISTDSGQGIASKISVVK
ncbi:MAG: T9SS type A sorting domain-containing protein [Bacteroidota bacterium]